jgi:hypothetical protein
VNHEISENKNPMINNDFTVHYYFLQPGQKIDDYWDVGKAQLNEPSKFLESLFKYDKDNIPDDAIKRIQPYIDDLHDTNCLYDHPHSMWRTY